MAPLSASLLRLDAAAETGRIGLQSNISAAEVGSAVGLTEDHVSRVYRDIVSKRRATRYLHLAPVVLGDVSNDSTPAPCS